MYVPQISHGALVIPLPSQDVPATITTASINTRAILAFFMATSYVGQA